MPEILHTLPIGGSAESVFDAITQERGLKGWWTRYTKAKPDLGNINEFGFNAGAFLFRMRVDELDAPKRVKWTCLDGHEEWANTTLEFDIEPAAQSGVLLHFAHRGFKRNDGVLPQCSYDWAQYLRSLRMLIENGKGTPH